ncbi:hypothetical protein J3R83DRAFT_8412 [Lanmaoa asiatica]|nr:hypothetical protein J3R83DRAFT_8412 [Lanmaoa asiatica]
MWHHKISLPTPLKDVQIAVQADESRRYDHLPSPAYPFERQPVPSTPLSLPLQENHSACQLLDSLPLGEVEPSVLLTPRNTINYRWNDSLDPQDDNPFDPILLHSQRPYRSFTPPISPPVLSPPPTDTEYSSKRSGMTFALVPAEVDGKHVLTHVVVNRRGNDYKGDPDPPSIPPGEDGLPEDMQDILRQLDDLASWVKVASSSTDCIANIRSIRHATRLTGPPGTDAGGDGTGHPSDGLFINKGKSRLLSTSPPNSGCGTRRDLVVCTTFHRLNGALKTIKHPGILKRCYAKKSSQHIS